MANAKQRRKNRITARELLREVTQARRCRNCGEYTADGHFVPPCFGSPGFFICQELELPEGI